MKEITESVYDIRFAKFILYEAHDMGKVRFADILTIDYFRHERCSLKGYVPRALCTCSIISHG